MRNRLKDLTKFLKYRLDLEKQKLTFYGNYPVLYLSVGQGIQNWLKHKAELFNLSNSTVVRTDKTSSLLSTISSAFVFYTGNFPSLGQEDLQ